MADKVVTKVIVDNSKEYIAVFTNTSDGTGEAAVKKVDVSALTPAATRVRIRRIAFACIGMAVKILWDATTDTIAWICNENQQGDFDFSKFGGLFNPEETGVTGDIMFTTVGHTAADSYVILLECDKV